ncbi:MAG: beta-lactamase family protein [Clostridia bacterium]|nr:beta-lactamase family protein [Clostridia bacterium]
MNHSKELTDLLGSIVEKNHLAGVSACIMGPEGMLYEFNAGFIDKDESRVPDHDTMFGIASMSKSITALCTCILAVEGRLSLEDPVVKFFPQFRVPGEPRESVTVRHLAMHTAGIPPMEPLEWSIVMNTPGRGDADYEKTLRASTPNKMETIEEVIDYIANCPYPNTGMPGQNLSYSNEGYAILSYIVDQAAGMPLEQFMHERVFAPLGMTRSILDNGHLAAQALSGGNMTSLFEMEDGKRTCDDGWSVLPPFRGCAMVKSTSKDMATYYRMLSAYGMHEGKQVIPREAVDLLLGSAHPVRPFQTMCMGINKRAFRGHVLCEHAGGLHGVSTKGGLVLGEGIGMAVLCNRGDEDMDPLLFAMYNAVLDLPLETSHDWFEAVSYPFSDFEMLTGRYICHEGIPSHFTLTFENDTPVGHHDETQTSLIYCGGTRFRSVKENGSLYSRIEFLISGGKAWGVRCGTRIYHRESD